MRKICFIGLSIVFSVCLYWPACAEDMPGMEECTSIGLRSSEGWWLRINNDGSGSYGFGALPARVEIKKDTFRFEQVYTETRKAFARKPKNAEKPYMAVTYWRAGSSSAREYCLAENRQLLAKLFLTARDNALPPSNEIEKHSNDQIESFWQRSPWIESLLISHDKVDAHGGL